MSLHRSPLLRIGLATALGVFAVGAIHAQPATPASAKSGPAALAAQDAPHDDLRLYIVQLREPALAAYQGGIGNLRPAPRQAGRAKLDSRSPEALAYVAYLKERQSAALDEVATLLGRQPEAAFTYQHALNGMALWLDGPEALRLAELPAVAQIEISRDYLLDTDAGPTFIGAPTIWDGSAVPGGSGSRGEGVVLGILDSGANLDSPSFSATASDGYVHVNPNGAGNFVGHCDPANPGYLAGNVCNDKLFGGYDFIFSIVQNDPDALDDPLFDDENGHGSHTASTAGGNPRTLSGGTLDGVKISGVAPRASLMIFDVCYTRISTGQGLCAGAASVAAVNQAIADGFVDVINYSIGGGASPWTDTVSIAFRNAAQAGILVAASAGNSGPNPATLGHNEPWTITSANGSHDRGTPATRTLSVDGGPQNLPLLVPGTGFIAMPGDLSNAPIRVSPSILGCTALPAGTFAGGFAVMQRGDCNFSVKAENAAAAGAQYVVIYNNRPGGITNVNVSPAPIPVLFLSQTDGAAIGSFLGAAAGTADYDDVVDPPLNVPSQGDVTANTSSRGPAPFDLLKPDVINPGTNILAAVNGPAEAVDFYSGTSMSSPHTAGSAALLYAVQPTWTPMEVKSALMLTAKTAQLFKTDGVTPADPFDVGAGRVQLNFAARSGLVMDESIANFIAANPSAGGNPSTLNLAGLQNRACTVSCSFTRSFRNPTASAETYSVAFNTASGLTAQLSTASLSVPAGQSASLSIDINSLGASFNAWNFAEITLTPTNPALPTLHMPVAIFALQPSPSISTTAGASFRAVVGQTLSFPGEFTIANNSAFASLNWSLRPNDFTGTVWDQPNRDGSTSGIVSSFSVASNAGAYTADDFVMAGNTSVTQLFGSGFDSTNSLASVPQIRWSVFASDPITGLPVGDPETNPGAALFTHSSTPAGAGVTLSGGDITLNLGPAGRTLNLPPGRYWLSIYPTYPGTITAQGSARWNWRTQGVVTGDMAHLIAPQLFGGVPNWTSLLDLGVGSLDTVFRVNGTNACGATWLQVTPTSGTVPTNGSADVDYTVNTSGVQPGVHRTNVCVQSNDANRPLAPVGVTLEILPELIFSGGFEAN